MSGVARSLTVVVFAIALSGCVGTGSQWVAQTPAQSCTINATSGLGIDSPGNNATGLSSNGVILSVTITYVNVAPILWAPNTTVSITGSNGATFDLQLALTTNSPIKPYWAGLMPTLAPRTFYTVSERGQPSQIIGCFTTG